MSSYPLTKFEIPRYYQNESQFNGLYSQNCLLKYKIVYLNLKPQMHSAKHVITSTNTIKEFNFYYALMIFIFIVNFLGLFQ